MEQVEDLAVLDVARHQTLHHRRPHRAVAVADVDVYVIGEAVDLAPELAHPKRRALAFDAARHLPEADLGGKERLERPNAQVVAHLPLDALDAYLTQLGAVRVVFQIGSDGLKCQRRGREL